MQIRRKNRTFDDIIGQTSLIGALEMNKMANFRLSNYVKDLNGKYRNCLTKLDEQSIQNRQIVYGMQIELDQNIKSLKKKDGADEKLPNIAPIDKFVKNLAMNKIDNENLFLPFLLKNLEQQKKYSKFNFNDMVEYNMSAMKSAKEKKKSEDSAEKFVNPPKPETPMFVRVDKPVVPTPDPEIRQIQSELGMQRSKYTDKDAMNERIQARIRKLVEEHHQRNTEIKSIRRDRLRPHEFNEFVEYKMRLLRVMKNYDKANNVCSKKCEFKNKIRSETDFGHYDQNSHRLMYS
jgi:hypothetical protein